MAGMVATILYNLVLLAIDAAALRALRRRPDVRVFLSALAVLMLAGAGLALLFGVNGFDHMRLMTYVLFVHVMCLSFASAYSCRSSNRTCAIGLTGLKIGPLYSPIRRLRLSLKQKTLRWRDQMSRP